MKKHIQDVVAKNNLNNVRRVIEIQTNIMHGSCIAKVISVLNETFGDSNLNIDTQNPKKTLTVSTEYTDETDVIKAVEKVGFKAEELIS